MKRSFRVLCLVGLAIGAVVAVGSFSPACARRGDGTNTERSTDDDGSSRRGDSSNRGGSDGGGGYSNRGGSSGGGGYENRGGSFNRGGTTYRQDYSYRGGSAYRGGDGYRGDYRGGYRGGYPDRGGYYRHSRYQGRYDHCARRYRVGGHRFQRCMDGGW